MSTQIQSFFTTMNEKHAPPFGTGRIPLSSPNHSISASSNSPLLSAIAASHQRVADLIRNVDSNHQDRTTTTTHVGVVPNPPPPPNNRNTNNNNGSQIVTHIRNQQQRQSTTTNVGKSHQHADIESLVRESKRRDELLLMQTYGTGLRPGTSLQSLVALNTSPLLPPSALLSSRLAMQCLLSGPPPMSPPRLSVPILSNSGLALENPPPHPSKPSMTNVSSSCSSSSSLKKKVIVKILAMDCDRDSLSDYQCMIRQHMELFEANVDDTARNVQGRNKPVVVGQVGIRCRHCALAGNTQASLYFPTKLDRIYQAAQNLSAFHLCQDCPHIPAKARRELISRKERKSPAGGGKRYWAEAVQFLGVKQVEGGLFFDKSITP